MANKITVRELTDEMLDTLYTEVVEELVYRKAKKKTVNQTLKVYFLAVEKMLVKFHCMPMDEAHEKVEGLAKRNEGNENILHWEAYHTAADLALPPTQATKYITKNYTRHRAEAMAMWDAARADVK